MLYSSMDNPKIRGFKKLQTKKYRDEEGLFFVEGEHLALEAYKTGYLDTLILKEGLTYPFSTDTIHVTDSVLKYLTELETPPTVMAVCRKKNTAEINGNVIMLEDIQDPGNLGTIIRSAVAFNIDTIILSKNSVDPYNQKVIRASQGLNFHINIIISDLKTEIGGLKQKKYDIIGTKVKNGISLGNLELQDKYAIVMGNEGSGLSDELTDLCDALTFIEVNDKCESLNVGVAASIILYELDK